MNGARMPIHKWSSGRGALLIIAVLFTASALARMTTGSGQAIAREVAAMRETDVKKVTPSQCETYDGIEALVAELNSRDDMLTGKERELGELEQSLSLAKKQIQLSLLELTSAEENLSAKIAQSSAAAETDLARLTSVYENMKPKDAALLFEEMNATFAAGFIGRMRPDAAAQVMAGLAPQTAYSISVILAGRNANAPRE